MTPLRFRTLIYQYADTHGRHRLPWRLTTNPYRILVSEVMLQQTQVERVVPYYRRFLKQFPTVRSLADAPLGDVLRVWQGLGYNRRAKMLHACAQALVRDYNGKMPRTYEELITLPGIGPYTAGAILAFAYNIPVPLIETNVRTAHLHHFFPERDGVPDGELMPIIEKTLDRAESRRWYNALMDYGTHLKQSVGNVSRRSAHHVKQTPFKGSNREIRGAILRALTQTPLREDALIAKLRFERKRIHEQLQALEAEGMIRRLRGVYRLP